MKSKLFKSLTAVLTLALMVLQFSIVPAKAADLSLNDGSLTVRNIEIIADQPNFRVDGGFFELEYGLLVKPITGDNSSKFSDVNMMAPLRDTIHKLLATYTYDDTTKKIQICLNTEVLTMTVDSTAADVDGKALIAPFAPKKILNHGEQGDAAYSIYLPVKFVFESLGGKVGWNKKRNMLTAQVILTPRKGDAPIASGGDWTSNRLLNHKDSDYATTEAAIVADNVVEFQNADGGWMKLIDNIDMTKSIKQQIPLLSSTIDNNATFTEMDFLAKVYEKTGNKKYSDSFVKGLNYLINGQYPNGGWGQYLPDSTTGYCAPGYFKNITINDNAMINVMNILYNIKYGKDFTFIDKEYPDEQTKAVNSFDKGLACLLKLQVTSNGVKAAWAQQYDKDTLQPAQGRAFELPSITAGESVNVVDFLMSIPNPTPEIIDAVNSSVKYLDKVKIVGKKVVTQTDYSREFGKEQFLADAPGNIMWSRFYEIGTDKPLFSDRRGKSLYDYADISYERRNSYSWFGGYATNLINIDYPKWLKTVQTGTVPAAPNVTADDVNNKVVGMDSTMEYRLDGAAAYTQYAASTFDAIDLSGTHTLYVRVAAQGTNPAGADTVLNFTINGSTISNGAPDAITAAINNAPSGSTTVVDITSNPMVSKDVFNDIAGQDKNVMFQKDGISWNFNGKNINLKSASDIDLSLKPVSDYLKSREASKVKEFTGKDETIIPFSFNYNGSLPAPATVKVYVDKDWAGKQVTICRYYEDKNTYEKITNAVVDPDGYITISINHCSDYFATQASNLPKTGSFFDSKVIIGLASVLSLMGALFIAGSRKRKLS